MGYFEDDHVREIYETAANTAYKAKVGIWSIEEVFERYENIISDHTVTEFDLLGHIPSKKSAIERYLKQSPKARIISEVVARKKSSDASKRLAENIVEKMMRDIDPEIYDVDQFKKMCSIYLDEIKAVEEIARNGEVVKDCIMHVEDIIDEFNLGQGVVKGNFSKGKNKLIYHDDPNDRWYQLCVPEIMFKTKDDAKKCGFKKRK